MKNENFSFSCLVRVIVAPIKVNDSRSDRSEISSREFSTHTRGSVVVPNVRAENEELALTRRCSTSPSAKQTWFSQQNQPDPCHKILPAIATPQP